MVASLTPTGRSSVLVERYQSSVHQRAAIGALLHAEASTINANVTGPVGDLDGDGVVSTADLIILLGAWGVCR